MPLVGLLRSYATTSNGAFAYSRMAHGRSLCPSTIGVVVSSACTCAMRASIDACCRGCPACLAPDAVDLAADCAAMIVGAPPTSNAVIASGGRVATARRDSAATARRDTGCSVGRRILKPQAFEIVWQHLAPPRPIMIHVVAPQVENVSDPLVVQQIVKIARGTRRFVRTLSSNQRYA